MNKETIKLFEDGEYKEYTRDMAKQPLNLEDWMNSISLDAVQHNYANKSASDKELTNKDASELAKADIKFIVNFFKGQFTFEQAKAGIEPTIMLSKFNDWYKQSSGVLGITGEDQKK